MNASNRQLAVVTLAIAVLPAAVFITTPARTSAAEARSCESLAALALPNTTITAAQAIAAGTFSPPAAIPGGGRGAAAAAQLYARAPAFCRVAATLAPSSDSDIKIEVWLPATGWNGKFQAVGNGGWAGVISYPALAQAVAAGYASASTDTGHVGNTGAFALGHPEKVIDFGYRAVHEMAVQAKALVNAYYGNPARVAIWNGCSQGGRQGITEAQRYPADFDAIIAGAPAVNLMRLHAARVAMSQIVNKTPESYIPTEKYNAVRTAVLEACDAQDGVKDGVLENPTSCRFDPKALECKGADGPSCLTPAQVETARALYAPVKHPKTGSTAFPALLLPGTESGWATLAGPAPIGLSVEAFKYTVFNDANWDWHSFNPATDLDRAVTSDKGIINSGQTDLRPYFSRGGKLLIYHGWSDPQVAAMNTVNYFNDVTKTAGKEAVGKSVQLYMVPGMAHCAGGPGTDTFDKVAAIEQWIQTGRAPAQIIASHATEGRIDRTRPVCPFGQVARWKDAGSTDEAANFSCVAEAPSRATR